MNRREKIEMLQKFDEKTLTERFLIPLYSEGMKCKNVQYTHGILEFGRDIIYYTEDEYGDQIHTGVQVKAKKITARSISTIFRQITEAFGMPFTDLSDGKKRILDKVVLLTSNEFTDMARESLQSALNGANIEKPVKCIDGNKLVALLDKYLPSAFWDEYDYFKQYFETLIERFKRVRGVFILGLKEPPELKELWVPIKLSKTAGSTLQANGPRRGEEITDMQNSYERQRTKQILEIEEAVDHWKKLVITGKPGSGKTTALKYLCIKSIEKNQETLERKVTPIFITLRELTKRRQSLRNFINDSLRNSEFPETSHFIEEDIQEGKVLLLLDGFDELDTQENQKFVIELIDEFLSSSKYDKNQIIVTSREATYLGELTGFVNLSILDFDDEQIRKFAINRFGKTGRAQRLVKAIMGNNKIKELAHNPLLLSIISVVYEKNKKLLQRRADLYKQCIDVLLFEWDERRGIKKKYQPEKKEFLLQELAFFAHMNELRRLDEKKILSLIEEHSDRLKLKGNPQEILIEIWQRDGLLVEVYPKIYEFLHLSFQEYFTACKILRVNGIDLIAEKIHVPWWREVILLCAGIKKDATELIREIQKRDEENIFYPNLFLFGNMIACTLTEEDLEKNIIESLKNLFESAQFSHFRNEAGKILTEINREKIKDFFIRLLRSENVPIRSSAAEALGNIGTPDVVEPLLEALKDSDELVRSSAARALGHMDTKEVVQPLIKRLKNPGWLIRSSAARALGHMDTKEVVQPLIDALEDDNPWVRISAARALGHMDTPRATEFLMDALKNVDGSVRISAAEALGHIGSVKAVNPLIEVLTTDEDNDVRGSAAEALGHIGSVKAVNPLIEVLTTYEDNDVQGSAAEALGHIGSVKAVNPLIEVLTTYEDSNVRGSAAEALGYMDTAEVVQPLIDVLKDKNKRVQDTAFSALAKVCEKLSIRICNEDLSRSQLATPGTIVNRNPKKPGFQTNRRCYYADFREKKKNPGKYP